MYLVRRAWAELKNEVLVLPSRTAVLVWVLALLALPWVYADAYVLRILTMTCLFAIFAASWDLLAGYTGQVNFGHALYFGVGAYASALLSLRLGITPWATIWAGAAVAAFFGFASGYLVLRLRGSYLSLATLAFPLIVLGILFAFPDFSGGELGISGLRRLAVTPVANYYIAALSMLVVVFGLWALGDSKFGIVLHAIRDDEVAARASGINTLRYKLVVFSIAASGHGLWQLALAQPPETRLPPHLAYAEELHQSLPVVLIHPPATRSRFVSVSTRSFSLLRVSFFVVFSMSRSQSNSDADLISRANNQLPLCRPCNPRNLAGSASMLCNAPPSGAITAHIHRPPRSVAPCMRDRAPRRPHRGRERCARR